MHRLPRRLGQGGGLEGPAARNQNAVLPTHHWREHLLAQPPIGQTLQQGIGSPTVKSAHLLEDNRIGRHCADRLVLIQPIPQARFRLAARRGAGIRRRQERGMDHHLGPRRQRPGEFHRPGQSDPPDPRPPACRCDRPAPHPHPDTPGAAGPPQSGVCGRRRCALTLWAAQLATRRCPRLNWPQRTRTPQSQPPAAAAAPESPATSHRSPHGPPARPRSVTPRRSTGGSGAAGCGASPAGETRR